MNVLDLVAAEGRARLDLGNQGLGDATLTERFETRKPSSYSSA